jgi:hypothetical protein
LENKSKTWPIELSLTLSFFITCMVNRKIHRVLTYFFISFSFTTSNTNCLNWTYSSIVFFFILKIITNDKTDDHRAKRKQLNKTNNEISILFPAPRMCLNNNKRKTGAQQKMWFRRRGYWINLWLFLELIGVEVVLLLTWFSVIHV